MREVERDGVVEFEATGSLLGSCPGDRAGAGRGARRAPAARPHAQAAHAADRQPVRDHRLRPAQNLVVYALQWRYDVEAIETEARDHATEICREAAREGFDVVVAFGGDGTRQRGRQRPRRLRDAADGAAGRLARTSSAACSGSPTTWSTRPSTCCAGRRLPAAPGRPGPRQRPPLRLPSRRRARRRRRERVDAPPAAEGRVRRLVLTLRRRRHLLPPLPRSSRRACASSVGRRARSRASPRSCRTRTRSPTSAAADPGLRGRRARRRHAPARRPQERHAAGAADAGTRAAVRAREDRAAPPPGREPGPSSSALRVEADRRHGPSPSRSTATTSATSASRVRRRCRARCWPLPVSRRRHAIRVEHRLDVAQAGDAVLSDCVSPTSTTNRFFTIGCADRAAGLEDVDPGLGEGSREVLEQAGSIPAVDLQLDPERGLVVSLPGDLGEPLRVACISACALGQSSRWIVMPRPSEM